MNHDGVTVYTALFGNYEQLVEQPIAFRSQATFICFTDNAELKSETWEIRVCKPPIAGDSVRSARKVKILGFHKLETELSVWIDNRVVLKVLPEVLIDRYLATADLALPRHDHRASVAEEFNEVVSAGLDVPWRIREQLHATRTLAPSVLQEVPFWTAILLRRRVDAVSSAMSVWWDQVALFSRRDQLSVNFAIHESGLAPRIIEIPNAESDIHEWLRADRLPKRNDILYGRRYKYTMFSHVLDAFTLSSAAIRIRNKLQRVNWAMKSK